MLSIHLHSLQNTVACTSRSSFIFTILLLLHYVSLSIRQQFLTQERFDRRPLYHPPPDPVKYPLSLLTFFLVMR
jgi:hypothetical protein